MFKKIINLKSFLILTILIVSFIFFGTVLRQHYIGGKKFKSFHKSAVFVAKIPTKVKNFFFNKSTKGDLILPIHNNDRIYDNKEFLKKNIKNSPIKEELIIVSRHDGDLGRSIVEIRDLNSFEILHSYMPNIEKIYEKIDLNKEEFKSLKKDYGKNKFFMQHPEVTSNGELIFHSRSPLVKINFNSKIIWVNDTDRYRYSINTDLEGNIYVPSHKYPFSKKIIPYLGKEKNTDKDIFFYDDAINILDNDGNIKFSKSLNEIFIENGLVGKIFSQADFHNDPVHLNDIQPVLKDSIYFKKGDLFLSLRKLSMILIYRPSTNKIIKMIEGDFYNQYDVDIIDEKTISIYNNNVFWDYNNKRVITNNEIVIYDFESDSFSKKFTDTFKEYQINSRTDGLIDFLDDGSAIVEDYQNGRIFYLNYDGEVIWEFNNLASNKRIYKVFWSRLIGKEKSKKLRQFIKKNKNY